uniref:Uncharacterized protein n=1 Tax=uncultured marine group II/III euryarchaeote AD1000_88_G11 TaxID=1457822 RepID=A0A075G0L3_9EURY|nr:hypothetical protein [uncultured marine group II/III euryarchaeote AD1000_88_G11]
MNFINKPNAHAPDLFGSRRGAVKGVTVGKNHNILRGGRRTRRKRRRRRHRGGGYGFSSNPLPDYGKKSINWVKTPNSCGQKGGGPDSRYLGGQGKGRIYHGFTSAAGAVPGSPAPMTRMVESQCGGRRRRTRRRKNRRRSRSRRRGRRRRSRRRRSRRRRRTRRRSQRGCRRKQRGGGKPSSPSYQISMEGDWKTANPPPFRSVSRCGPENYNHYKN